MILGRDGGVNDMGMTQISILIPETRGKLNKQIYRDHKVREGGEDGEPGTASTEVKQLII